MVASAAASAEAERDAARARAEAARAEAAARADREFEAAVTDLAREIAELRRAFHHLIDQMGRVGEAGRRGAQAGVAAASTEGWGASERATAELGGELKALREDMVRTAREHPWRTLGLAAAAGVVLGILMRR